VSRLRYHHPVTPLSRTAVIACAAVIGFQSLGLVQSASPTLVIVNARVFTGVPAAPWAEALTIVRERIGTVGTNAAVRALAGSSTRVIDARGRLLIPGINDAHVHVGT
jgi:imidazolonepropionase-like amidohydrolase